MHAQLNDHVFWVGFTDWNVRDFHGYDTFRGSTYNAYLVKDRKTALIDTVKYLYADQLLTHIRELTPLDQIDYVVCNHAEPDHSSSLPAVMAACPQAELLCNAKCKDALGKHYDTTGWKFRVVKDGETLSLGARTLTFLDTPMAHWPESMATLLNEDQLLFSMDAFGQHLATANHFDDEESFDIIMEENKTYYANILTPYGRQVQKVLDRLAGVPLKMIAPSHGVIWRSHIPEAVQAYRNWSSGKTAPKVLVIYDTMWKSTERMAEAIVEGATDPKLDVQLIHVRANSITKLATDLLDTAAVAVGSSTLNMSLMPQLAGAFTYTGGLRLFAGKPAFAFGSYGWGKGGPDDVQEYLKKFGTDILCEPIKSQFAPTPEILAACRAAGARLKERALAATA